MHVLAHLPLSDIARAEITCREFFFPRYGRNSSSVNKKCGVAVPRGDLLTLVHRYADAYAVATGSSFAVPRHVVAAYMHSEVLLSTYMYVYTCVAWQLVAVRGKGLVAAGSEHTLVITGGGGVSCFGRGAHGRLGLGRTENTHRPTRVLLGTGVTVTHVSAGAEHSMALTRGGRVMVWGGGWYGQLGLGDTTCQPRPMRVPTLHGVVAIGTGLQHSVAATMEGRVYTWGDGRWGALGHGDVGRCYVPTAVSELASERVIRVDGGSGFTAVLTRDATMFTWGINLHGQLGHGDREDRHVPTPVRHMDRCVDLACGYYHTVAVKSTGSVFTWGYGARGQLGHAVCDDDVDVPTWVSELPARCVRVAAGEQHTAAVSAAGGLYSWGTLCSDMYAVPHVVPGCSRGIVGCATGEHHSMVLKRSPGDGPVLTLHAMGAGGVGQLGLGMDVLESHPPTRVAGVSIPTSFKSQV